MDAALQWIAEFLDSIVQWIFDLVKTAFLVLWDMLIDLFCFIVEMVLDAVVLLLEQIPVPTTWSLQNLFDVLPASVLSMLVAIGFAQALGIVLVALGIRFLLQLIPFIRLGS